MKNTHKLYALISANSTFKIVVCFIAWLCSTDTPKIDVLIHLATITMLCFGIIKVIRMKNHLLWLQRCIFNKIQKKNRWKMPFMITESIALLSEPSIIMSQRKDITSYIVDVRDVNSYMADVVGYIFMSIYYAHFCGGNPFRNTYVKQYSNFLFHQLSICYFNQQSQTTKTPRTQFNWKMKTAPKKPKYFTTVMKVHKIY